MQIKIKKLKEDAVIPEYKTQCAAAFDFTVQRVISETYYQVTYGTGIAVEIPTGNVGLIFPRSSIRELELSLSNHVGVIDSDYRGEIMFTFNKTNGPFSAQYIEGERCGQMIIIPSPQVDILVVDQLSETKRGTGGFGSTGK